jgi:predicted regulator of Ras-like GTPase activity (Roadblock/LC7/MglB family)
MMETAAPSAMVRDLKARLGATAAALISRGGTVLYADLPAGTYADTFAVMCATIFGAAVTAGRELDRAPPDRIVIQGADSTMILVPSGGMAILAAVIDRGVDPSRALEDVAKFAAALAPR